VKTKPLKRAWVDLLHGLPWAVHEPALIDGATPSLSADSARTRLLIQFICELGAAMSAAGDATTFIRRLLERIGRAYGLQNLRVSAGTSLLLVRYQQGDLAVVDLTTSSSTDLLLDQVADIYSLADEAERAAIDPATGLERLHATLARPARHGALVSIAGLGLIASGLSLVLAPSFYAVAICGLFGIVVGLIRRVAQRWPALWPFVPVVAGGVVAALGLAIVEHGQVTAAQILIPPLAVFLPGATITVAMIELSEGDIVSGGSRLAFAAVRLLLLAFGIVIAAEYLHWQGSDAASQHVIFSSLLGLVGIAVFTIGVYVHYSAPRGSAPWLLLVVLVAWATQQLSGALVGTYVSAAIAGAMMIIAAGMVEDRKGAPPLIVSYTPAFWLLVPGSLGLKSFSQLVQDDAQGALTDLTLMVLTMISISLGILVGLLVTGNRRMYDPPASAQP
jgi:uncharacterized membrane protein YjjP (DUF1212 family)